MTQFKTGDSVRYGMKPGAENHGDEAEIIGYTLLENGPHYVLRNNVTKAFIRPEEYISLKTTLPEYVAAYIKHELDGRTGYPVPSWHSELETWVANAFEAYEEGAR